MVSIHEGDGIQDVVQSGPPRNQGALRRGPGPGKGAEALEHSASFGEWLTQRRQSLHLPRAELAARIGCAVVTLRKIESDERRPSRQMAEQLAEPLAILATQREVFIRVARGELPVSRLPLPAPGVAGPTNLPYPTTACAGRAREVAEISALLARPEVRLLTITGAPGVGKTRLAIEVAAGLAAGRPDGIFFVPLAPLIDPRLVLVAMAQALHVAAAAGQPLAERLGRYLRARRALVVLDNFEHVLAAAPQLTQILAAAPHLQLLVTSRASLEISGERRFIVLPLLVPPAAAQRRLALPAAEEQARYPAVALFIERARAANPSLALTDANLAAIGEICRRLDGLPLAIEFAAARAALFTPQELLAQLDDRFTLTTTGARDLPPRHLTLERAIDWSYSLLTPPQQRLFRALSVFSGGWTMEAAQAVCGDGADPGDIVAGLSALLAGSLLQRQEDAEGHSRFGMLETLRDYGLSRLAAAGEAEALRARHAAYYLRLAQGAEEAWDGPTEWQLLRRLVAERDNLRATLRWAHDAGDVALAWRLHAALFTFWTACSTLPEARVWLEAALALPRPANAPNLDVVEAKLLNVAGYVAAETGAHMEAIAYFDRGRGLYRAAGDDRGVAWSLRGRALVHVLGGEYAAAGALEDESLRLCKASGDEWGLAWSLYARAFLQLAQGDLAPAGPALEDALALMRRRRMPFGVFRALLALGHTRFEQGDLPGAEALFREGLALSRDAPLLTVITIALDGLAMVAAMRERPVRAARLWGAAEAMREQTDEQRWGVFQAAYDRALGAARAQLSAAEWAASWAAGRALPAAQAIAEALESAAPPPGLGPGALFAGGSPL